MKKILRVSAGVGLVIATIFVIFLTISFIRHKLNLSKEKSLLIPLGELVEVDGHKISIYTEGKGKHTLVFLSGGGTASPILDFRSLYSLLSDDYKIAVVEKFGYGFSDIIDGDRTIDTVLRQTRTALSMVGADGPYILCPHSMSGIEALYWAQQYPEEVEAIVGLDMAVPQYYDGMKLNLPLMKLGQYGAALGVTRWIPKLSEVDAIRFGTLTDNEKDIYRAVFFNKTATVTMIDEAKEIQKSAEIVKSNNVPEVPMLMFISNGSGVTGFDKKEWRSIAKKYISNSSNADYIELDCPHYVHNYEYNRISAEIKKFIEFIEVEKDCNLGAFVYNISMT